MRLWSACRSDQTSLFSVLGAMYAAVLFLGVNNSANVQPVVAIERTIFYREQAAGMYSAIPYAIAQVRTRSTSPHNLLNHDSAQNCSQGLIVENSASTKGCTFSTTGLQLFVTTLFQFIRGQFRYAAAVQSAKIATLSCTKILKLGRTNTGLCFETRALEKIDVMSIHQHYNKIDVTLNEDATIIVGDLIVTARILGKLSAIIEWSWLTKQLFFLDACSSTGTC